MKKITVFVVALAFAYSGMSMAADRLFPSGAEGHRVSNHATAPTMTTPQKKKLIVSQKKRGLSKKTMNPALDYSEFNDESDVFIVKISPY